MGCQKPKTIAELLAQPLPVSPLEMADGLEALGWAPPDEVAELREERDRLDQMRQDFGNYYAAALSIGAALGVDVSDPEGRHAALAGEVREAVLSEVRGLRRALSDRGEVAGDMGGGILRFIGATRSIFAALDLDDPPSVTPEALQALADNLRHRLISAGWVPKATATLRPRLRRVEDGLPEVGADVLGYTARGSFWRVLRFDAHPDGWHCEDGVLSPPPTHWCPLSELTAQAGRDGGTPIFEQGVERVEAALAIPDYPPLNDATRNDALAEMQAQQATLDAIAEVVGAPADGPHEALVAHVKGVVARYLSDISDHRVALGTAEQCTEAALSQLEAARAALNVTARREAPPRVVAGTLDAIRAGLLKGVGEMLRGARGAIRGGLDGEAVPS